MIFSSLFKSKNKWQSKDSTVRIAAINDELSIDDNTARAILLDLIAHDDSDMVRRAALIKLADFSEYVNASQNNSQSKVKSFAQKQVQDMLYGQQQNKLTEEQKLAYLANTQLSTQELDAWLDKEQSDAIVLSLFKLLKEKRSTQTNSTQQLIINTFAHKSDVVKREILDSITEPVLLEKLLKKTNSEDIADIIAKKLADIAKERDKPVKIKKQAQLLVSKLLALKEVRDYSVYLAKKAELESQWHSIADDLNDLTSEDKASFIDKYAQISLQLTNIFAGKAEAYEQEKIALQLAQDKANAQAKFTQRIAEINQALTTSVFEHNNLDEQAFAQQIAKLSDEVNGSVLNTAEKADFSSQLKQLNEKLTKLPEIAESVSQATHLISKMSQLALPERIEELNDKSDIYQNWLKQWQTVEQKSAGILPESIVQAHQDIVKSWHDGLQPLQQQQKQSFHQVRKKLSDIKRLLASGKFKVCFGLFKGVKTSFALLSPQQAAQLQRDFQSVSEKMSELSDWEHYIATPRKQEMLKSIQALVEQPLDNPNEQAKQVKQFRKTWNSLGHADEEIDHQLNDEFNQACELAFAPCRRYYAEQEKLRADHFANRQALIEQADNLAKSLLTENNGVDFKDIDAQLNKLQHAWQGAGEVDRQHYQSLHQAFKQALQPIKTAIKQYHEKNVVEKNAIIAQAEALLNSEDVFDAINQVKGLQATWKTLGYAGSHQDGKLWQSFRKVNDQLFAKREQLKHEQQDEYAKLSALFDERLSKLTQTVNQDFSSLAMSEQTAVLNLAKQSAVTLLADISDSKPVIKSAVKKTENLIADIEASLKQCKASEQKMTWQNVFNLITALAKDELSSDLLAEDSTFVALKPIWQKRLMEFIALPYLNELEVRAGKTLEIEILAQVESPAELKQQRMQVQVQLMQSQMQSGSVVNLEQLFVDWLMLGKLHSEELSLLSRLSKVYC